MSKRTITESRQVDALIVHDPDALTRLCQIKARNHRYINPRRQAKKLLRLAKAEGLRLV